MDKKEIQEHMDRQRELGYPGFKRAIMDYLIDEYDIEIRTAREMVLNKQVHFKIVEDIELAQKQGVKYWADYILDTYE